MGFEIAMRTPTMEWKPQLGFQQPSWAKDTTNFNISELLYRNRFTPLIQSDDAFKFPGLTLERQYGTQEIKKPQGVKDAEAAEDAQTPEEPQGTENKPESASEVKVQSVDVGDNNGQVIIIVGDHNEVNVDDLPKPHEGEVGNANGWVEYLKQEEQTMVCRDDSGRTQNISGKFETKSFNTNPDEFTITDNSSGEDHVYKYKKVGVDDKGRPIYTCVSMNGQELDSNQYTLVWKDDGTPELVQYSNQDNYGIGLRKKRP